MPKILVLSGPICSGKSDLAKRLARRGFRDVQTSLILKKLASEERRELQEISRQIDRQTNYGWIADSVTANFKGDERVVIDAARFVEQIAKLREHFSWRVVHVHLDAPDAVLKGRFDSRKAEKDVGLTFEEAMADLTEASRHALAKIADLTIDTSRCDADDVYVRVSARLGLYAAPDRQFVDVLIGGQWGSEGKGQVAAYLAREYDLVMRVGGPNAGHRVSSESGTFTYIHLPSGCRDHSARILIGAGAVIQPETFQNEVSELGIDPARIVIDSRAFVVTPTDIDDEKTLKETISSTGQGVGSSTARKIWDRGAKQPSLAANDPLLKAYVGDVSEELERAYAAHKRIFLEGTQGAGLSLHHGPYPYVTSRDTNVAGCLAEAGISPSRVSKIVMVTRSYPIRVANPPTGTSGPLRNEIDFDLIASRAGLDAAKLKASEVTSRTKRPRRVGEFDWVLYRQSCALNAPTDIAFTFADYISIRNRDAFRFEQLTTDTISFIEELERVAQAPVSLINTKFDQRSVIDRRNWGVGRGLWTM